MSIPVPENLRCEYLKNPVGIDTLRPRFSWTLGAPARNQAQIAYRILVSADPETIAAEKGDMWDSGKIESPQHINLAYSGPALHGGQRYYWRVKWWDNSNQTSGYSAVARFDMGLLKPDDWHAKWISTQEMVAAAADESYRPPEGVTSDAQYPAAYFRNEFSLDKPVKSARAYVCGLGYYELRLNGEKVGDHVLDPAWTDYDEVALYATYDITERIQSENAVGIILGNGRHLREHGFGALKCIVQIELKFADGETQRLCTDRSWKHSAGPLSLNGLFFGERYDARLEMDGWDMPAFDDAKWTPIEEVTGPRLAAQMSPPVRVTETLKPVKIINPDPGVYVVDFGQNFSGWTKLMVQGTAGAEIKLHHAELIHEDGRLNPSTNKNARATDVYILKGGGTEIYEPKFTYHGFRYVQITGFPGVPTERNIEGRFVHSDVGETGDFSCDHELINRIHRNVRWGQLSNFMSVPTDSPQREERQGWMGDAVLSAEEAIFNFDMAAFYSNFVRSIQLAQKPDGSIPDVVPPYWRKLYPADPAWGTAYISLVWYLYWYYGDRQILETHYESLKKYIDFLRSQAENHIQKTLGKYGDWCPPGSIAPKKTPIEVTSSWYYYHDVLFLSKIAAVLEHDADSQFYSEISEQIKAAYNTEFLEKGMYKALRIGRYDNIPNQTANAMPLFLDMVPEDSRENVLKRLLESIIRLRDYHLDTGIHGTRYVLDVLAETGHADVAYKIITQKSYPSWGYMIAEGATTLWETWEPLTGGGVNSHNHIMQGSVDAWLYKYLVGITCVAPGWDKIQVKPFIPANLKYATATLETIKGSIHVSWEKSADQLNLALNIPTGARAEIHIPRLWERMRVLENDQVIWENGNYAKSDSGITFERLEEQSIVLSTGAGFYRMTVECEGGR